ncbi:MAG: 4Fe-4S binding protein [Elusimicrobia bacterium]|nr:4Fe-4S binding protein [Elusimicrobiota bacterium]
MGHVVWTYEDTRKALPDGDAFWLSDCSCRKDEGGGCKKGMRVCLGFSPEATSTPDNRSPVGRKQVEDLFKFARAENLVPRPWVTDDGKVTAVCFCCPCCCTYILGKTGNAAGPKIESTIIEACTDCGACEPVCYFGARKMSGGKLEILRDKCFGCGLCAPACPAEAIRMAPR